MSSQYSVRSYLWLNNVPCETTSQQTIYCYGRNTEVECDEIEGWPENNNQKKKNLNKSAYKLFKKQIY